MFGRTHSASSAYRKTSWNLLKPLRNLIFGRNLRKIGICFGNRPIADFFHDQTIFIKDCELYTIGHSLEWFHQKLMEVMLDNWLCLVLFTWMYYPLCLFLRPSLSVRQIWQLNFPRYVGWHHPRVGRDPWFGMQVFLSSEYHVYPVSTYLFTYLIYNIPKQGFLNE